MAKKKIEGYEDKGYNSKEDTIAAIRQAFENVKQELNSGAGWNRQLVDMNGIVMKFDGVNLQMTYMRYETTTPQLLAIMENQGSDFFKEFEKNLKKEVKTLTKKTLKLKKVSEDVGYEKVSRTFAETCWSVGQGTQNTRTNPMGTFLVREFRVYEYSID